MLAHKQHLGQARPQQQLVHHPAAVLVQHQPQQAQHQQHHHHHHQQQQHLQAPLEQPAPGGYYQTPDDSYGLQSGGDQIAYQGPLDQELAAQRGFAPQRGQQQQLVGEQQSGRIYQQQQYQHATNDQPQVPPHLQASHYGEMAPVYQQPQAANEAAMLQPAPIHHHHQHRAPVAAQSRHNQHQLQQHQQQPQAAMRHQQPYGQQQSQAPVRIAAPHVGGGSGARLSGAPQAQYAKPVGYAQPIGGYQQQPAPTALAGFGELEQQAPSRPPLQARQQHQHQHQPPQHYPSSSPTLLQQQLNRQQPQAPQQLHQQPLVKQTYQTKGRQRYLGEPEAFGGQQHQDQQQHQAYPIRAQQQQQLRGGPQQAALGQQQAAHLLGNPTPPLTPNSSLASLQQPAVAARQQHPAAEQWQAHQHHVVGANEHHQQQQLLHHHAQPTLPPPTSVYGPQATGSAGKSLMAAQHHHQHPTNSSHHPNEQLVGQAALPAPMGGQQARIMPKNSNSGNQTYQQHRYAHNQASQAPLIGGPTSHQQNQMSMTTATSRVLPAPTDNQTMTTATATMPTTATSAATTRLTLPLRDPLMGPFRLEHDAQFTSKVFHLDAELFELLSKSMCLNQQTAAVTQELQFRAYLVTNKQQQSSDSLLASNHQHHHHHHHHNNIQPSSGLTTSARICNWPELFQVSVNQNIIHLDRSKPAHKASDIFQFCQLGDNILDIQVNDCYCTHEFVLEPVDRPTLKAFVNSCFKSRLLAPEDCIQKMKHNLGLPGFLVQSQHLQQTAGIFNEYISEFVQGIEQTRTRISLRCPISARRMRTPTRGHNCKHLQCFDLESFLFMNRDRSQWSCPICSLSIPFNMLELDKHQLNIVQTMCDILNTDDILIDSSGQWQAYYGPPAPIGPPVMQPQPQAQSQQQQQPSSVQTFSTAKSTGTYHPQPPMLNGSQPQASQQQPLRPMSGPTMGAQNCRAQPMAQTSGSPAPWETASPQQQQLGPIRRPASAIGQPSGGRRSTNGSPLAKKPYAGSQYSNGQPTSQFYPAQADAVLFGAEHHQLGHGTSQSAIAPAPTSASEADELSPLAAMERAIIQHEQQMGPPPFDPSSLTSSPASSRASAMQAAAQPALSSHQSGSGGNQSSLMSSSAAAASQQQPTAAGQHNHHLSSLQSARSPAGVQQAPSGAFSPHNNVLSPASTRVVPASPQQQHQRVGSAASEVPPQSPMQPITTTTSISTPATPSMLAHGGPETPATPSNSIGHMPAANYSPHLGAGSAISSSQHQQQQNSSGVDHQPLSNGSASAGSITSSSTMTPSGQSLGSVGMGSDSRCGTAPLQIAPVGGLDELLHGGNNFNSSQKSSSSSLMHAGTHLDHEKNDLLIGKLMMDSSGDSILRDHRSNNHHYDSLQDPHHHNHVEGELAIAFEEADWKQQLDRGKSEHLANFLNEPLMNKKPQQQYHQQATKMSDCNSKQQQQQQEVLAGVVGQAEVDPLQALESHGSSPSNQLADFANYLDADAADNGAGLPPDDSILDLFER